MYDVVFYDAAHKARALELVNRLPVEELDARRLEHGLVFWFGAPLPDETGAVVGAGNTCTRWFYGANHLPFGAVKSGRLCMADYLMLEKIEDGLTVGNYRELERLEGFTRHAENERANELKNLAKRVVETEEETKRRAAERLDVLNRWRRAVCCLGGVAGAETIGERLCGDVTTMLFLAGKVAVDFPAFAQATAPEAFGETELPEIDRSGDPERSANDALQAVTHRREVTRR